MKLLSPTALGGGFIINEEDTSMKRSVLLVAVLTLVVGAAGQARGGMVILHDEDGKPTKLSIADVNVDDLEQGRLKWLERDVIGWQRKLQELEHGR